MSDFFGTEDSEGLARGQEVRVEVHPHDAETTAAARLADELVRHHAVRAHLPGSNLRLATFELLDKDAGDRARFEAVIFDPDDCRCVRVQGTMAEVGQATAHPLAHRQRPSDEDFQRAVESVLRHDALRLLVERDGAQAYRPMPPYLDLQSPDGSVERMVTVGLRTEAGDFRHRIVGVLANGGVVLNPDGVARPTTAECEPPATQGGCDTSGGRDQVRVRVIQGSTVLWDFILVRPRASSDRKSVV